MEGGEFASILAVDDDIKQDNIFALDFFVLFSSTSDLQELRDMCRDSFPNLLDNSGTYVLVSM